MSWARWTAEGRDRVLATGYSCRCQAETIDHVRLQHPVQALLHAVAVVKAGVFTILKISTYIFGPELITALPAATWPR